MICAGKPKGEVDAAGGIDELHRRLKEVDVEDNGTRVASDGVLVHSLPRVRRRDFEGGGAISEQGVELHLVVWDEYVPTAERVLALHLVDETAATIEGDVEGGHSEPEIGIDYEFEV